jgi:urease accessory protein
LLAPRTAGRAAWVYTSTFGGGLLAGDDVRLRVMIGEDATCFLGTQSQTKVYRSIDGRSAKQALWADVATGATLVAMPDPVSCFADAVFEQRQRFDLSAGASLIWLEWLTSGRRARGERWAFRRYESFADVRVDRGLVFRDAIRLDRSDGRIDSVYRMGACDCFATVLLLGPRLRAHAEGVLKWSAKQPVRGEGKMIFSASPLGGGAVMRVAGPCAESVGTWVRDRLEFVPSLLGADPWKRKW